MTTNACPNCGTSNRTSARFCSSCGEPLLGEIPTTMNETIESALKPGTMLQERYQIEKELGRGGFGAVYRAYDTRLKKYCAVKENMDVSPEAQRQFSREATVLAGLTHSNLPRVTDHFTIQDMGQYLVMDYVEGEDLQTLVQRDGRLPAAEALRWTKQVADALIYLHSRIPPVVHRDIKPANIRITSEDRAVLVDFGLVKLYDPEMRTTIGARAITPGYAPPEQYGRGGSTDVRTDIYALGATLYNILTGRDPLESVQRLSGERMIPAHQLNPSVQPHIGKAISHAMELNPENRFQTATKFRDALEFSDATVIVKPSPAIQASPVVAPEATYRRGALPARSPSQPARNRNITSIIIGVLVVAVILCLGTVGLFAWLINESESDANLTSTQRAISIIQTATGLSHKYATKTAEHDVIIAETALAETAISQDATADAAQFAQTATVGAEMTALAHQEPLDSARSWGILMDEQFINNVNDWVTGERDGEYAKIRWTLGEGTYRWETTSHKGFVWWVYPELGDVGDFYLTSDIRIIEGPSNAEVGLMFWHTEENAYYLFEIDNQGRFAVYYYDSNEWTTVWDWTESPAIIQGETNRLEVLAQGGNILLYINDQFVAEVFNSETSSGTAGLLVGLDEENQSGIWEFYNFELRIP